MKVAVSGKGGVGKTTIAASIARALQQAGHRVTAVDADPDANLAGTLGYRHERVVPLVELKQLIEERVGGQGWGGFLRMNPRVDDIPERFSIDADGIRVLVMGTIDRGRSGCACPENILLREVLNHLLLEENEHVVVDMEAGIEHFGRGTAEGVDCMLIVVEPGWASLETAKRICFLSRDLGIRNVRAVANKVQTKEEIEFINEQLSELSLLGELPRDPGLEEEVRQGMTNAERPFHRRVAKVAAQLVEEITVSSRESMNRAIRDNVES
jgi:CO dehydrogenase maturation factor